MTRREFIPKDVVVDPHNLQLILQVRTHRSSFVIYNPENHCFFLAFLVISSLWSPSCPVLDCVAPQSCQIGPTPPTTSSQISFLLDVIRPSFVLWMPHFSFTDSELHGLATPFLWRGSLDSCFFLGNYSRQSFPPTVYVAFPVTLVTLTRFFSLCLAMVICLAWQVNGQVKQNGCTSDMMFKIPALIEYVSSIMTLEVS